MSHARVSELNRFFCGLALASLVTCDVGRAEVATSDAEAQQMRVNDFQLKDFRGKIVSMQDIEEELVVVFFMGTECPLAKLYGPRMHRICNDYSARGVAFLGISSNVQDSIAEIAAYARDHQVQFPILKDLGCQVADLFGATRTPEVFVLDQERRIRYQGRIDGQYTFGSGVGLAQPVAKRNDLQLAIDELLAGHEVSVPKTTAKGCLIGRPKQPEIEAEVTYSNQIARIFAERCVECHREGQIAPFALTDYDEVAGWGEMIEEVVREQRMPPWHANPKFGHFSNENRLTDREKEAIYQWVSDGCPEGDPQDLPEPREYNEGWFMGEPDLVIAMKDEPVEVKAEGVEDYRYYVVDPGFEEDKWISMAECMPGNRSVVHHIIVYLQSPNAKDSNIGHNEMLVGFAPGTRPYKMPKGWAKRIPAGSKLVFEMHYTPIGTPQVDRSSVGFRFIEADDVTHHVWTTNAINWRISIPPHAANHREMASKEFSQDTLLVSLFPHMHMRGKAFRYDLTYPDGREETLLDVPRYDFNWQTSFVLNEPKLLPKGTKMVCTAIYDNSEDNLANPDPTKVVGWGQQTWEEMLIGWHDVAVPR